MCCISQPPPETRDYNCVQNNIDLNVHANFSLNSICFLFPISCYPRWSRKLNKDVSERGKHYWFCFNWKKDSLISYMFFPTQLILTQKTAIDFWRLLMRLLHNVYSSTLATRLIMRFNSLYCTITGVLQKTVKMWVGWSGVSGALIIPQNCYPCGIDIKWVGKKKAPKSKAMR